MKKLTVVGILSLAPIAAAQDTDFYLSVPAQGKIMRVDSDTMQATTHADGVLIPHYGWFHNGDLYMPDRGWPALLRIKPDGTVTAFAAGAPMVKPVTAIAARDGSGLLLSDSDAPAVFHIDWDGNVTTLYTPANTNGLLTGPDGMDYDADGNLYLANLVGDTIIKIDPQGNASLFSDDPLISQPGGLQIDGSGNMFVAMYGNSHMMRFYLDTGEGYSFAYDTSKMASPSDLRLSRTGGLIASTRNSNIVRLDPLGNIDVLFNGPGYGDIVGVSSPADGDRCQGSFVSYGQGKAGSGGYVPEFRAIYSPCLGLPHGLEFRNFNGGATALMFITAAPASIPFLGGEFLLDLSGFNVMVPVPLPGSGPGEGDLSLGFVVPDNPNIVGVELFYQVLAADPGATFGVSMSNGLHETIGS